MVAGSWFHGFHRFHGFRRAELRLRDIRKPCYDPRVRGPTAEFVEIMSSIQATRLKKGMLVKMGEDLFRVLDLQHVTPGNLRGFVRVKFRNIRIHEIGQAASR